MEDLRTELRAIDFYRGVVERDTSPPEGPEKLEYNVIRLAGSAIVQEYHHMIQKKLKYSYLITERLNVQLQVPYDDPETLYYDIGEPNLDVDTEVEALGVTKTQIESVMCLCLMSCRSQVRD